MKKFRSWLLVIDSFIVCITQPFFFFLTSPEFLVNMMNDVNSNSGIKFLYL